jgi:hypothetical protein
MNRNTHALVQTLLLDAKLRGALFGPYVLPLDFPFLKDSPDQAESEAARKFHEVRDLLQKARTLLQECQEALIERVAEPADVEVAAEEAHRILGRSWSA